LATPLGLGLQENWQKALGGVSGVTQLELPGAEHCPVQAAGVVAQNDWRKITDEFPKEASVHQERRTLFALWAAQSALVDAALINEHESGGAGVVLAAGLGICRLEDIHRWVGTGGEFDFMRFGLESALLSGESFIRNPAHRAAALIARKFRLRGGNCTVTSACASATQAIGIGHRLIQDGESDWVLAGGADSMVHPTGVVGFLLLQAAATACEDPKAACRPFDRKRSGLVIGEGAGIAVLEDALHARARGARIYAEVAGYGSSMDAYQVTAPHPSGQGAALSMAAALRDADLDAHRISYINAHGTGTKLNDVAETLAIKAVFGEKARQVPISSSKSLIGHLMAAAGGPEFVFTVLSVHTDEIHPTINLTHADSKCDLDYVPNVKRIARVQAALSNSFGFGGQNASILVKKYGGDAGLSRN
jgi:3-oxoacyl-[acyl-carrier-protein] synthase II